MSQPAISTLYGAHLREMMARADRALAAQGYDGLVIASGGLRYLYLDDNSYPFKPNPRYRSWLPDRHARLFHRLSPRQPPDAGFPPAG